MLQIHAKQRLQQIQMTAGGNGQKFRKALHKAQKSAFQNTHQIQLPFQMTVMVEIRRPVYTIFLRMSRFYALLIQIIPVFSHGTLHDSFS